MNNDDANPKNLSEEVVRLRQRVAELERGVSKDVMSLLKELEWYRNIIKELVSGNTADLPDYDPHRGEDDFSNRQIITEFVNSRSILSALIENTDEHILFSDAQGLPLVYNSAYAAIIKKTLGIEMKPGIQPHKLLDGEERELWDSLIDRKSTRLNSSH